MSNTFNTQLLAGSRVLVTGTDNASERRSAILDSTEWDTLRHDQTAAEAAEEFDRVTKAFYAPLTEAAERAEKAQLPKLDPAFTYVVTEGEPGTKGVEEHIIELAHDTVVLRLLEQGDHSRLVWVGDKVEVLAAPAKTTPVVDETPVFVDAEPARLGNYGHSVDPVIGDSTGDVTTPDTEHSDF